MRTLERFRPVSLEEIVSEAALMTRVDRKYAIPRAALDDILPALDPATRVLEIDDARRFAYASVYFDTPALASYMGAAQPRRRRFKVRTRSYVDTGGRFLEIKLRGARGVTAKARTPHEASLETLPDDGLDQVRSALDHAFIDPDLADELQPTLTSRYQRATLLAADASARVTIDTDLMWRDHFGGDLDLPDLAIVETKSGARPSDADRVLWRAGFRPQSMSKYATGMAALRPDLPHNRWKRIIRRSFTPDPNAPITHPPAAEPDVETTLVPEPAPTQEPGAADRAPLTRRELREATAVR